MKKSTNEKPKSYTDKALSLFQSRIGEPVTSEELAQITGAKGNPISHNIRRIFELRDEKGYNLVNHKDNDVTGLGLKVNEWVLVEPEPNPKKIRSRGVNKRIMAEVLSRDHSTCKTCGRTPEDDDPFMVGHKIKMHIGHIIAHKREYNGAEDHVLTKDDFVTQCNVCNEGTKNTNLKPITLLDRIAEANEETQKEIFESLKNKFK